MKVGDVVIRTVTPLGTKLPKFRVRPWNTKSRLETSFAENVDVPVEPATPVIIPVDRRNVAIGLPDEKLSKSAKFPLGDELKYTVKVPGLNNVADKSGPLAIGGVSDNVSDRRVKKAVASLGFPEKNGPGAPSTNKKYPATCAVPVLGLINPRACPSHAVWPARRQAKARGEQAIRTSARPAVQRYTGCLCLIDFSSRNPKGGLRDVSRSNVRVSGMNSNEAEVSFL
jgi:hypothetical protein